MADRHGLTRLDVTLHGTIQEALGSCSVFTKRVEDPDGAYVLHKHAATRIAELEAELALRVDHGKRLREVELENRALKRAVEMLTEKP